MKIVLMGGGSGPATMAPHLKNEFGPNSSIAVGVTVADDGGSSGDLLSRRKPGLISPGDLRNVASSLAENEDVARLLKTRINGISIGNLALLEHMEKWGIESGVKKFMESVLQEGCEVLPVTAQSTRLVALLSDGTYLRKEHRIGSRPAEDERVIDQIMLEPKVRATETILDRIMGANLVVLGPGSLQTSIVPNLVVGGVSEALRETRAKLVFVVNLFTNTSETRGYNAPKYASVIVKYIKRKLDLVLCNDASQMSSAVLAKYLEEQGSEPVWFDPDEDEIMGIYTNRVVIADLLDKRKPSPARHSRKTAKIILDWYSSEVAKKALVPARETCGAV